MKLHTREQVETSDPDVPLSRYRVPGGWLYQAVTTRGPEATSIALCFVPDQPASPNSDGSLFRQIFGERR